MWTIAYTTLDEEGVYHSEILRVSWESEEGAAKYADVLLNNWDDVDSVDVIYLGDGGEIG